MHLHLHTLTRQTASFLASLLAIASVSADAAILSLNSTNDYRCIHIPTNRIVKIDGYGVGPEGSYNVIRDEDIFFLTEAAKERRWVSSCLWNNNGNGPYTNSHVFAQNRPRHFLNYSLPWMSSIELPFLEDLQEWLCWPAVTNNYGHSFECIPILNPNNVITSARLIASNSFLKSTTDSPYSLDVWTTLTDRRMLSNAFREGSDFARSSMSTNNIMPDWRQYVTFPWQPNIVNLSILTNAYADIDLNQHLAFIRPAYYYSNESGSWSYYEKTEATHYDDYVPADVRPSIETQRTSSGILYDVRVRTWNEYNGARDNIISTGAMSASKVTPTTEYPCYQISAFYLTAYAAQHFNGVSREGIPWHNESIFGTAMKAAMKVPKSCDVIFTIPKFTDVTIRPVSAVIFASTKRYVVRNGSTINPSILNPPYDKPKERHGGFAFRVAVSKVSDYEKADTYKVNNFNFKSFGDQALSMTGCLGEGFTDCRAWSINAENPITSEWEQEGSYATYERTYTESEDCAIVTIDMIAVIAEVEYKARIIHED